MSFSVGIVGLPNVGKSTLFKALTRQQVDIADYPFTTIHPNVGIVPVPDERLQAVAEIIKPEKITPTVIEFIDIAGLIKNAHKGEGLGNQFLAQIRNCDAICQVVKAFGENPTPEKDIKTISNELAMKDEQSEEKINLLSKKPVIYLFNSNKETDLNFTETPVVVLDLKMEEEISELSETEREELQVESRLDKLILACYNVLELITFYTITGGKETRAWTLRKDSLAPEAGGKVHSDFEEKFIKAEIINWQKLFEASSWQKAREKGLIQTAGKDYVVRNGDVIEFKI